MEYEEAITKVEAKLLEFSKCPTGYGVKVYDYAHGMGTGSRDIASLLKDRPYCGIRISEVSFHTYNAGSSYMQVDVPHGLLMCAAVERVLLSLVEDWEEEEIEEEFWRLAQCFEEYGI